MGIRGYVPNVTTISVPATVVSYYEDPKKTDRILQSSLLRSSFA